ncbi:MAG: hypothetical protein K0S33_1016 [Bacteroidetes bacterium]|jgi:hypothetical protein|nr:hypothetical protein [Bacteroidota bacterium]
MNIKRILLLTLAAIAIGTGACRSSKTTTAAATPPASSTGTTTANPTPSGPLLPGKARNGVYAPGAEELSAIQLQFPEATSEQLREGYLLYMGGACVGCHNAKNIYTYTPVQWKDIITDMAKEAKISDAQKDAVYKYVLAIKATEGK